MQAIAGQVPISQARCGDRVEYRGRVWIVRRRTLAGHIEISKPSEMACGYWQLIRPEEAAGMVATRPEQNMPEKSLENTPENTLGNQAARPYRKL